MNVAYNNRSLFQDVQTKDTKLSRITPAKRLAYALVGLLAGDLMLFFFLLQHALHATLLAGEPAHLISDAVQMFILYMIFSFVGWLFVGMPTALSSPPHLSPACRGPSHSWWAWCLAYPHCL